VEGQAAEQFLRFAGNLEHLVQIGMLADAGDEGMLFTRFCDQEQMDTAMIASECSDFLARIKALFLDGQALTMGYTKLMLEAVKAVKLVILPSGPMTIGCRTGAPPAIIQRCLQRMAGWVSLAASVIAVEFPSFELLQSFSVFSLSAGGQAQKAILAIDAAAKHNLARLAHAFDLDAAALESEYMDHRRLAHHHYVQEGCDNVEAWRRALQRTQQHLRDRACHPAAALGPALQRYVAYRGSTSGVEQTFSLVAMCCSPQRLGHLSEQGELDTLTLVVDAKTSEHTETLELARCIWRKHYGAARRGKATGCALAKARTAAGSEASWLRRRRSAVSHIAAAKGEQVGCLTQLATAAAVAAGDMWTPQHQHEADLQAARLKLRRAEDATLLLPSEADAPTLAMEAVMAITRQKNFLKRVNAEASATAHFQRPGCGSLAGSRIHIQSGVAVPATVWQLSRARRATNPVQANVWLVSDPTRPGLLRKVAAGLCGGRLCTAEFVESNGSHGCCLAFHRACLVQRWIWISHRFQQKHAQILELIRANLAASDSRWKELQTCAEFVRRSSRRSTQAKYVGLVTVEDKLVGRHVFSNLRNVHLAHEFADWVARADAKRSSFGLGGS
jgi:hypothetical protein